MPPDRDGQKSGKACFIASMAVPIHNYLSYMVLCNFNLAPKILSLIESEANSYFGY